MPVGTYDATDMVELKRERLLRFRPTMYVVHEKTLLSLHYVAEPSRFWAAFYSFLQLLWPILRALALVPRKVLKNAKNHVLATFALKIALFSQKTGAKAHT